MRWVALLSAALPAAAHTVSISTGGLEIQGAVGHYRIVMPAHEIPHVREPERAILGAITIAGARLAERQCRAADDSYICDGKYVFDTEPQTLRVSVKLHETVVANHIHILTARRGGAMVRAVFNSTQTVADLNFSDSQKAAVGFGAWPVVLALCLMAATLSGPAGQPRQTAVMAIAVLCGAAAGQLVPWRPTPSFTSATLAITAAYCAFESVFIESERFRWIAWFALGLAFEMFASSTSAGAMVQFSVLAALLAVAAAAGAVLRRFNTLTRVTRLGVLAANILWLVVVLI